MWGNDKDEAPPARPSKPSSTVDTLIGRQTEVTGDIHFTGGLHVDGKIKGKVTADQQDKNAVLSISESGAVEGDVRVPHIVLNGTVEGDVHAIQRITLSAKAKVNGNVYYRLVEMTGGAMINGQMVYEGDGAGADKTGADKVASIGYKKPEEDAADDGPALIGAALEKTSL